MASKHLGPKLFTLSEAEAALPFIRERLARCQDLFTRYEVMEKDLSVLRLVSASGGTGQNPDTTRLGEKEQELAAVVMELKRIEDDLLDLGCVPKSIPEGLIDFFALRDGRLVFLCWKQGEDHIQAWHTLEGGFSGRRRIASFLSPKASGQSP